MEYTRPKLVLSKCLGFEKCRYNGDMEKAEFIQRLRQYADIETICPETAIGLGTPRQAIRLVDNGNGVRLIQPKTNYDCTDSMYEFAQEFLGQVNNVDGFILKSRSPTCGTKDVKVYASIEKGSSNKKGTGLFSALAKEHFPSALMEDEGRLSNYSIREKFLIHLFLTAQFRIIHQQQDFGKLIEFHEENQLLYRLFSPEEQQLLSQVLEQSDQLSLSELFQQYQQHLEHLLSFMPTKQNRIHTLTYCLSLLEDRLTSTEYQYILRSIDQYNLGLAPYSVSLALLELEANRLNLDWLKNQRIFAPYPEDLIELRDSGKMIQ